MHAGTTRHVCSKPMMDKLECPIELGKPFTKAAQAIREDLRSIAPVIPFHKSKYYRAVVDLREVMGVDALLHVQSRFGNHADKLELLDTGTKSWDANMTAIAQVYDGNPEDLPVRRVDLCADTDVDMGFVARSVRGAYKRLEWQFGEVEATDSEGTKLPFMEVVGRELQTLQFGCRPNLFRVYNKVCEREKAYRSEKRRQESKAAQMLTAGVLRAGDVPNTNKELNHALAKRLKPAASRMLDFPSFNEWSGYYEWQTVTRVERQISGKVPLVLSSVGAMRDNLLRWNPFERLNFSTPLKREFEVDQSIRCEVNRRTGAITMTRIAPNGEESFYRKFSPVEWRAGVQMWTSIESGEESFQQLYKSLGKNASKVIEKFEPFLYRASLGANNGRAQVLSADDLFETYRESMKRQLAA